ncbi:hypothetical protein [Haloferula sp. A504]|uniref:hypothetical protein n=1 Tax=Haloferula sp. A504 TaxID=3373601 RepID=UPI0031C3106A|nr:hypothetical protein [Verrucomicrobiaceae bacterium E54]
MTERADHSSKTGPDGAGSEGLALEGVFEVGLGLSHKITIPAVWHPAMEERMFLFRVEVLGTPALEVLTDREVGYRAEEINDWNLHAEGERQLAKECHQAKGRVIEPSPEHEIALPADWCEELRFKPVGSVWLVGWWSYFQIVSPESQPAVLKEYHEEMERIAKDPACF